MKTAALSLPRVAIVRGGFAGVAKQVKAWALEREVAKQEKRVAALEAELATARDGLTEKRAELVTHWADHTNEQRRLVAAAPIPTRTPAALRLVK